MSSRAMRKLCNEPDLVDADDIEEDEDSPEDGVKRQQSGKSSKKTKAVINPFELLNDIDEAASSEDEDRTTSVGINGSTPKKADAVLQNGEQRGEPPSAQSKSKRKRKKKKKQKGGGGSNQTEAGIPPDEDEIDASIREVNEILKLNPEISSARVVSTEGAKSSHSKPLLAVEHKHLIPENELRRIFGASVIRNEQSRHRGRNRQYQKSTWLVSPKSTWPKMSKTGLSMKQLSTEGRYQTFTYEHSKDYQNVQFDFLDAVESMNPGNIMAIINVHPYHIDSLLQLSEISRTNEDMGMAIDLIERALYSFECAFHTLFSLAEGLCQLSYRRPENRGLFIALFRHLTYLGQKGCNRTALEFCKLLLSLDSSGDPLGVLLMIDYYALKTEQFDFFIRMFEEWEAHRNLSQLPNWAFSIAMAHYHSNSSASSSSSSSEKQPETNQADALLQDALLMFPSVLLPLLDKCSIQPDSVIASHLYFSTPATQQTALSQLVALFIARNYSFWKESDAMRWLERNAHAVIKRVDAGDPKVKENAEKRQSRYQGTPRNIYRHIFLSEHLGVHLTLPTEMSSSPMMSYDPLPPKDSIVSYTRPSGRPSRRTAVSGGMFSEFLRSLVPTYIPPNPGDVIDDINEDLGAAGGYLNQNTNLRQGIGAVMDAMRELLQTLEPLQRQDGEPDPQLEEFD